MIFHKKTLRPVSAMCFLLTIGTSVAFAIGCSEGKEASQEEGSEVKSGVQYGVQSGYDGCFVTNNGGSSWHQVHNGPAIEGSGAAPLPNNQYYFPNSRQAGYVQNVGTKSCPANTQPMQPAAPQPVYAPQTAPAYNSQG